MKTPAITRDGRLRLDGRYLLIRQIGCGGMSVVWYALDEVLGRYVAVKVLSARLATDPQVPRRLLSEARAVAALSHPHITAVHDFGVHQAADDQWTPYLVMELLDGELLSDALQYGALPWRQAVTVCAELASALQAAHEHGIVHRDVKPANIMLTSTGVKVLDFGIAALIGDPQSGDSDDVFGTAAYLAPERLITRQITAAADVYAAGLVLYQCLAGHLPWPAETIAETLYAHAHLQPPPLPILGLPQAVEQICLQCLAREPHHRPTSAQLAQVLAAEVHRIDAATIHLGEHAVRTKARGGPISTLPLAAPRRRNAASRRVLAGASVLLCAVALGYTVRAAGPQPAAVEAKETMAVPCSVTYTIETTTAGQFTAALTATNVTGEPVRQWTLQFSQPAGQPISAAPAAAQQVVVTSMTGHSSGQAQTVSLISTSTLDAGASITRTLHGQYSGQPALPGSFTLNGKRCDATVVVGTAPEPRAPVTAAPSSIAVSTWDKPPGRHKPKKPHGKQQPTRRGA